VGDAVETIGEIVGESVGLSVGDMVGDAVETVGEIVGESVGLSVGASHDRLGSLARTMSPQESLLNGNAFVTSTHDP